MNRTYDCVRKPHDPTAPQYPRRFGAAPGPTHSDLRPKCPPVYDQGQLGACTGNGWAAVLQYLLTNLGVATWVPSRLLIYLGERTIEGDVGQDAGAAVADGVKTLETVGACDETLWPYDITKFAVTPPPEVYAAARVTTIPGAQAIDNARLDIITQALLNGLPVVFGCTVYESFESDAVAQSGFVPLARTGESAIGSHCMVIVGHDDATGLFTVRNSWGESWGVGGHCFMPYAYLTNPDLASDFWVLSSVNSDH